jgi:hypothetical protein
VLDGVGEGVRVAVLVSLLVSDSDMDSLGGSSEVVGESVLVLDVVLVGLPVLVFVLLLLPVPVFVLTEDPLPVRVILMLQTISLL